MESKLRKLFGVNLEHIDDEVAETIIHQLEKNGGNCLCVDSDSAFGEWLKSQGMVFGERNWEWVVVWR